jgi:hypothetical protein
MVRCHVHKIPPLDPTLSLSKQSSSSLLTHLRFGRAIAQGLVPGFSPRRPGFEPRSGHVGFVVDRVALGQVSSEYFGFPCQFSFHRLLHIHHHLSSRADTIGQLVADLPNGVSLTRHQGGKKPIYVSLPFALRPHIWPL